MAIELEARRPTGYAATMPLVDIAWRPQSSVALDHAVEQALSEGERRIETFFGGSSKAIRKDFVASDHRLVFEALRAIRRDHLATGNVFCEWGSGFGVIACLAALLGFDAYGVERAPEFVRSARALAADLDLPVLYAEADYHPIGFDSYFDAVGESRQLLRSPPRDADTGWERQLGITMEDVSILFIYPWPAEAQLVEELFEASAQEGSLLISYNEDADARIQRFVLEPSDSLGDD